MEEKKAKKSKKIDDVMKLKDLIKGTKIIATFGMIFNSIVAVFSLVYCVAVSIDLFKFSKAELTQNRLVINFLTKVNDYDIEEATKLFQDYDIVEILLFEVILPVISILVLLFLLSWLCKKALDFIKDVKDNETLFTKEKLEILKSTRVAVYVIVIFIFFDIDVGAILAFCVFALLVEYLVYMFDACVKNNK